MSGSAQSDRHEVLLEREATDEEVEAVQTAFDEAGVPAVVEANITRKSTGELPWVVLIVEAGAGALFGGLLAAAGADAWKGLKQLVGNLYEARRKGKSPRGAVVLTLIEPHEDLLLREDLPDTAWQQLFHMHFTETESGQLQWDPDSQSWKDAWEKN